MSEEQIDGGQAGQVLEGGAYEVIRGRLDEWGGVLAERLKGLNAGRQEVFGAVETALVSTERVTTEHACVPRDLVSVGEGRFLFGYNIQFGLKTTTALEDVFAAYAYDREAHTFSALPLSEIIGDGADSFAEDFGYLYKYYKQTVLVKFMAIGPHLFIAMRIGKGLEDIKTFKFLRQGDGKLNYLGNRFDHSRNLSGCGRIVICSARVSIHMFRLKIRSSWRLLAVI